MKAYKFRASTNIEFALDIILNRRFYCASWRDLNDPMEGLFAYSNRGHESYAQKIVKGIGDAKSRYRVCSLSRSFQSHLLWAHYASGFGGLAIEVNLPDNNRNIRPIDYRNVLDFININQIMDENEAARRILFSKYQAWAYEEEIRIISSEIYFQLKFPISRIIVGHRMNDALLRTLRTVCDQEGIEFAKVSIGYERIDADLC